MEACFLLIQKNEQERTSNLYCATTRPDGKGFGLPGGKRENNETLKECVQREAFEEGWQVELENINDDPFYCLKENGNSIYFFRGKNATKLKDYKEKDRLKPLYITREELMNSGNGNDKALEFEENEGIKNTNKLKEAYRDSKKKQHYSNLSPELLEFFRGQL